MKKKQIKCKTKWEKTFFNLTLVGLVVGNLILFSFVFLVWLKLKYLPIALLLGVQTVNCAVWCHQYIEKWET